MPTNLLDNQLFKVGNQWLNREQMLKARGFTSTPIKKEDEKDEHTLEELQDMCREKGIVFHHRAGINKLKNLLDLN